MKLSISDWAGFAVVLALIAAGVFTILSRDVCPSCREVYDGLRPVYDMDDKLLRWKCPKCWYPVRVEEIENGSND